MAEKETVKQETAAKEASVPKKIKAVGPKEQGYYTPTYTFYPTAPSKEPVKFVQNEVLEVGKDVTQAEALRLLEDKKWNFKEVK
jgi:hypothetical protein